MATQVEFPQTNAKNDKPTVSLLPSDKSNGKKRKSTIIIGTLVAILVIITACLVIAAVTETWPFAKEAHEQPKQPETDLTGQSNDNGLAANPGTVHIPQSAANPGTVHIPQSDAANPGTVHVPKSDAEAPSPVVIHSSRDTSPVSGPDTVHLSEAEAPSPVTIHLSEVEANPQTESEATAQQISALYDEDNYNINQMDAAICSWRGGCNGCYWDCMNTFGVPYHCCDGRRCCCYTGFGRCDSGGAKCKVHKC